MKVYLDDWRPKPDDYDIKVICAGHAMAMLQTGVVSEISLDYDLDQTRLYYDFDPGTGLDVAKEMCRMAEAGELKRIPWHLHSDNVEGRKAILHVMEQTERHWTEQEMNNG